MIHIPRDELAKARVALAYCDRKLTEWENAPSGPECTRPADADPGALSCARCGEILALDAGDRWTDGTGAVYCGPCYLLCE